MKQFKCYLILNKFNKIIALCILVPIGLVATGCRLETVKSVVASQNEGAKLSYVDFPSEVPKLLESNLKVGFADGTLVPNRPISLAGFGGIYRRMMPPNLNRSSGFFTYCLPYKSIDLAPRIKVQVWNGKNSVGIFTSFFLVSLDVVAVTADVAQKILVSLQNAFPNETITQQNLVLLATHTHSGPSGLTENPFWAAFACDKFAQEYFDFFEDELVRTAKKAYNNAQEIESVESVQKKLSKLNRSRFPKMPVDDRFSGYVARGNTGEVKSCLVQYSVHSTFHGQTELVLSSDIAGAIEQGANKTLGTNSCIFVNGAVGNADKAFGTENLELYGNAVGEQVKAEPLQDSLNLIPQVAFDAMVVSLPKPKPNLKACNIPEISGFISTKILDVLPERTKLSYLSLGENLLLFFPGEAVFTVQNAIEVSIKKRFPKFKNVRLVSLANDYVGYVVDAQNSNEQTLESCSTIYGQGIAKVLEEGFLKLLEKNEVQLNILHLNEND